ncbi:MAG: RNA-directed DNA polymerase [Alphaproteobacteria bacterium]|nr:RNA-directed DNA polymerase [Alphaproteobacteria bacterium]
MSKSARFKSLLQQGYFPEELPPPFHTSDLARFREHVFASWQAINQDYPKSMHETFSIPRIKKSRRNLAIINPVAQLHLSKLISDEWKLIHKHLRKSKHTIEIPTIENDKDRAVSPPDFHLLSLRRDEISANYDHALISDISRFYGTLYTHAIAWSLHTKSWCKANLNNHAIYKPTLGNRLDVAVRKGQDNQTIGIPVGPDTSRIISEIIAVSIDEIVQQKLNLDPESAFRHVDDWYIGFNTSGEAESATAILASACRDFELELNAEKTQTVSGPLTTDNVWPSELRRMRLARGPSEIASIDHYFAKAFMYSKEYPDQNVLDYAVKRARQFSVTRQSWPSFENYLLKSARANPTVIPTVVQILISYNAHKPPADYPIKKDRVTKLINDLIAKHSPMGHHSEVAWALFLAKGLQVKISQSSANSVSVLESSACALLALDLRQMGLIDGVLNTVTWQQSMTPQGLWSNMWLLAYEADLKGWLAGNPANFVSLDRYFSVLKIKKISFYDIKKNVKHIRKQKPKEPSPALVEWLQRTALAFNFSI